MSKGIGTTQQAILDALADSEHACLTVMALAERLGRSGAQVRRAVRSLEDRGLVAITKGSVWRGQGEYGRRFRVWRFVDHPRGELARRRDDPDGPLHDVGRIEDPDDESWVRGFYQQSDEQQPQGMPTPALFVWPQTQQTTPHGGNRP